MNELRILFTKKSEGDYTVQLVPGWSGSPSEPVSFKPFLTKEDYADLRWYLEEFMDLPDGGSIVRAKRVEENLEAWGHKLFEHLFGNGDNQTLLNHLQSVPAPRLLTIATRDPVILRLPWELMAESQEPMFRRGITIRRQLEAAETPVKYQTGLPLRILYIASRPADLGFIDPRHSSRSMLDAMESLGNKVVVDFCRPPTLVRMEELLREAQQEDRPHHVVHFDGHGDFLAEKQEGALCFEKPPETASDDPAVTDLVSAGQLGETFAAFRIPLVVLEACRTGTIGEAAVFRSTAPRLLDSGVGSVLSMSHAVHVEAARVLLAGFYKELLKGGSVGQAVEQGRAALISSPHRWLEFRPGGHAIELKDWHLPHLYQRGQDLSLFPESVEEATAEEDGTTSSHSNRFQVASRDPNQVGAFPPEPPYRFQGRAPELYELERQFRSHPAVILHAMGGMGKTTLACEAAHWWTRTGLFADGACFLSFEQPTTVERIIQVIGVYLDGNDFNALAVNAQRARAKELFRSKNLLMVWDNFESVLPEFQSHEAAEIYTSEQRNRIVELFREWTTIPQAQGRVLVTCRPEDAGLPGARKVELRGLARLDSLWLLGRVIESAGVEINSSSLDRAGLENLLQLLDDHPLSIELVGPHLKTLGLEKVCSDFQELLAKFTSGAGTGRNESLLASLEFSTRRLGAASKAALPWLGYFTGGVFESLFLAFSELDPTQWREARTELESTALIRIDPYVTLNNRPYIRFHPTLSAGASTLTGNLFAETFGADSTKHRENLIDAYVAIRVSIDRQLRGSNAMIAMAFLRCDEMNYTKALSWALRNGNHNAAARLGWTFLEYLESEGRLTERSRWAEKLGAAFSSSQLSVETAQYRIQSAVERSKQGKSLEAVETLRSLVSELEQSDMPEADFQKAEATGHLGRVLSDMGKSRDAVPHFESAIADFENLATTMVGDIRPKWNASECLCGLSRAQRSLGDLDQALTTAKRALEVATAAGRSGDLSAQFAAIGDAYLAKRKLSEANENYEKAAESAESHGNRIRAAQMVAAQADLADESGYSERAFALATSAVRMFQEIDEKDGLMGMYNLLGVIQNRAETPKEALAWFQKAKTLAVELNDVPSLGKAAQNMGIAYRKLAVIAWNENGPEVGDQYLNDAMEQFEESLRIKQRSVREPEIASVFSEIAQIHGLKGEWKQAEQMALKSREIRERLRLPEVARDYARLIQIALALGDVKKADTWERKLADTGGTVAGPERMPPDIINDLLRLADACAKAGFGRTNPVQLDPSTDHSLSALEQTEDPWPQLAKFLRSVASGQRPRIPPTLPGQVQYVLTRLLGAIQDRTSVSRSSPGFLRRLWNMVVNN